MSYLKTKYGGFIGLGKYNSVTNGLAYRSWVSLISKVGKNTTLKIHEPWLNFQCYCEWYENYQSGSTVLTKDLFYKKNNLYSPETCCFVPIEIKRALRLNYKYRKNNLIGVFKFNDKGKFYGIDVCSKKQKTCSSAEEAFKVYKNSKEKKLKELADKYRLDISLEVYMAICNFTIEMND